MQPQSAASEHRPAPSLMLNMRSVHLTDAQFYRLCADNPEVRLELSKDGRLTIMSPTGSENRASKQQDNPTAGELGGKGRHRDML
jgi:hypothetical protein